MPSCRNDLSHALAVAALALLMPAAALAQVGPPVHLLPPAPGAGPAVPGPPPAPTPAPAASTDEAIRSTPLAPVDSAWIGALEGGANALPNSMWQGTPRSFVLAALAQLQPTTSPVLQQLAHRLLLSNAIAPSGEDPPNQPSLAALRVERLIALGEVDGALGVLEALPAETRTDALDHERVELYFAKNDVAGACHRVQVGISRYQTVWWQRALIACQTLAGQRAEASLGLGLLREQKAPPDRVFDELIGAADGHAIRITNLPEASPLLVTLLAAAKLPLPGETAATADLPTLLAWAGNEAVPPLQRLAAAERATALGAMAPSVLGDLYAKVEFKPDELGSSIRQEKAPATPRERALLYQVARNDPASAVRATALKSLLAEAKKRGDFFTTARLVAPILAQLPPSSDLGPFAAEAVRALYAGGRPEAATPWLVYADPATVPLLLALPQLAGPGGDAKALHDAVAAAGHNADLARLLLSLMTAFGIEVTPGDWAPLIAPAHDAAVPSAALWLDQRQAAAGNRVGETVLTTLLLARAGDHLSTEPIVVAAAVSGLKAVGLDQDAHALAVEAALAAGL